jgi:hypothetical protein
MSEFPKRSRQEETILDLAIARGLIAEVEGQPRKSTRPVDPGITKETVEICDRIIAKAKSLRD